MADYTPDIITLIPQGPPFVMVDQLLWSDGRTTRTSLRVLADNPLVENGRFTAAGLLENLAQTAAAGAGYAARAGMDAASATPRPGFIASVKNLEIFALPAVDSELLTEIVVTDQVADIIVISGHITCKGETIAKSEMKILTSG
jgi:predicted hotdog family 3-hydroxylacyl-ACP dehydratase